jgi:hypothetical protein
MDDATRESFDAKAWPTLKNWNGMTVGAVRAAGALLER